MATCRCSVRSWRGCSAPPRGVELVAWQGPLRTSAWSNMAGALLLLPLLPWVLRPELVFASSLLAKGAVLYLGLGSSVLSYLLWFAALGRTDASRVAIFSNLQPVATALAAWALLGEHIGWRWWWGAPGAPRRAPRPGQSAEGPPPARRGAVAWGRALRTLEGESLRVVSGPSLGPLPGSGAGRCGGTTGLLPALLHVFLPLLPGDAGRLPAARTGSEGAHAGNAQRAPPEVAEVLEGHLHQLIRQPRPHLLGLGLLGAM